MAWAVADRLSRQLRHSSRKEAAKRVIAGLGDEAGAHGFAVLAGQAEKSAIEIVAMAGLSGGAGGLAGFDGVHGLGGLPAGPPRAGVAEDRTAEGAGPDDGRARQHPAPAAGEKGGEEHISTAS